MRKQWLAILLTSGVLMACGSDTPPEDVAAEMPESAPTVEPEPEYTIDEVGRIGRDVGADESTVAPDEATEAQQPPVDQAPESMDGDARDSLEARDVES